MKAPGLSLCTLLAGCLTVVACADNSRFSTPTPPLVESTSSTRYSTAAALAHPSITSTYRTVYSFCAKKSDGQNPEKSLIAVNGTLYGTTTAGGTYGGGTVFSINPSTGSERVLHSFGHGSDGNDPQAALINVNGSLYGTTTAGGHYGGGTVFSVNPSTGTDRVLHSFGNGSDGKDPQAALVYVSGTLYGTTTAGGDYASQYIGGTVFSMSTSGANERVLHSFGNGTDGNDPEAALIYVYGVLYGTTYLGGTPVRIGGFIHYPGTVFSISTTGDEKVLHSFGRREGRQQSDGFWPVASLKVVRGILYGTTSSGGFKSNGRPYGTVFSITTAGKETTIYDFAGHDANDGWSPDTSLIDVKGELYGATLLGGKYGDGNAGTVFKVTLTGETVLHSFVRGNGGYWPEGGLIWVNHALYGTTYAGGAHGCGEIYSLKV
jgi:uncharacterized repeat protein (TIGR03803 family)